MMISVKSCTIYVKISLICEPLFIPTLVFTDIYS